jgi:hypothetical protein
MTTARRHLLVDVLEESTQIPGQPPCDPPGGTPCSATFIIGWASPTWLPEPCSGR